MSKSSACLGFVLRWWRVVTSVSVGPAHSQGGGTVRLRLRGAGCGCNKWERGWLGSGLETGICVSDAGNSWADPESECGGYGHDISDMWWWHLIWGTCDDNLWCHVMTCMTCYDACDESSLMRWCMDVTTHDVWWHVTCDAWQSGDGGQDSTDEAAEAAHSQSPDKE